MNPAQTVLDTLGDLSLGADVQFEKLMMIPVLAIRDRVPVRSRN